MFLNVNIYLVAVQFNWYKFPNKCLKLYYIFISMDKMCEKIITLQKAYDMCCKTNKRKPALNYKGATRQ